MKISTKYILTLVLCLSLIGCENTSNTNISNSQNNTQSASIETENILSDIDTIKYIEMIVNDKVYEIELNDCETAYALYNLLPLTLEFKDYNNTEKISYLKENLPSNETDGYDPNVGDLCLYAPWGNLCIFYNDFTYSNGLVKIGNFTEEINDFKNLTDNFTAVLQIAQ